MSTDHGTGPDPLLPPKPLPELESELLGLAGHIAAAECRFLQLLAEFDRRDGWGGVGVRSCAHWLSWRAGMSMRTATEHLRIAHALENLPRIRAEFAAGRISYSKVRAITRVTGSDTAALARIADRITTPGAAGSEAPGSRAAAPGGGTPQAGGQVVPGGSDEGTAGAPSVDTDDDAPHAGPGRAVDPAAHPAVEPALGHTTGTAPEPGLDPTGDGPHPALDPDAESDPDLDVSTGTGTGTGTTTAPAGVSVADPDVAEQILLNLARSGTASHVETVVRAVRRRATPPTVTAARRTLSWYHDTDGSLVVRGRFTPEDGAELVAALTALVPAPIPVGQDPEQAPGPAAAPDGARRADALLELVRRQGTDAPVVARGEARVVVHIDASTGTARLADGPEIPGPTAERLACDARSRALLDDRSRNRLYLGRSRRLASPAQIAALTARDCADGGGCRFPACGSTRYLHAHHVQHWLRGGNTDIDNLVLLCGFHHRLVHDHGYLIRYTDGRWEFRRPDGVPVTGAGAPLSGDQKVLVDRNTSAGLGIDGRTLTPDWYGDRLDPGLFLDALLPPVVPAAAA
ncbi:MULTISPECIES: DUF222 domain-containing protein [Pseudonocardia]|uniref:HNH nuclease domain-containing protein n=2 Tax=Pseudonocardia TaxID=1847 RepID=A0A1Y2N9S1_PSEAH|nr:MULTISPECIES: DUF222 domain-containing protein [Pseudonocardia]OSY43971.1 hypothetical protein BG845_00091 [Pseudonocardia autotrophica]TDN74296.1 HNH endonuclease [Pseudonocardia autotrophica]BBG05060.1 hypothetical protein Pdca_62690 [Pseudonocardia autotrophica]GEC27951.1 hypothetical protein PSA01_49800 [Pseudonocardia saturnea]